MQRTSVVARTCATRSVSGLKSASSPKKAPGPSWKRPPRASTATCLRGCTNMPEPRSPASASTWPGAESTSPTHSARRSRPASVTPERKRSRSSEARHGSYHARPPYRGTAAAIPAQRSQSGNHGGTSGRRNGSGRSSATPPRAVAGPRLAQRPSPRAPPRARSSRRRPPGTGARTSAGCSPRGRPARRPRARRRRAAPRRAGTSRCGRATRSPAIASASVREQLERRPRPPARSRASTCRRATTGDSRSDSRRCTASSRSLIGCSDSTASQLSCAHSRIATRCQAASAASR